MNPIPTVPVQLAASSWSKNVEKNQVFVFTHLLSDILNYLPDSDLLQRCRLVSKSWRHESSSILRRRKACKCTFEYLTTEKTFVIKYPHPVSAYSHAEKNIGEKNEKENEPVNPKPLKLKLTELGQLLSSPFQTFPCSWFSFLSRSLNHPEAMEFFSAHGSKVKRLTVDIGLNSPTPTGFRTQRFFKLTPNLEILEFFTSTSTSPSSLQSSFLPQNETAKMCQNQSQVEGQNPNQPAMLPFLNHVYWQGFVKTGGIADISSVFNLLRSNPIAPQLGSLYISHLELGPGNQNENEGISTHILKTLSSTSNLRFGNLTFKIFSPTECPMSLLEAVGEESFNLQTEGLTLGNGSLTLDSRPSKAHLIRARRALWQIMKNTSDILEIITCSFKVFNLLTQIPFQPGIFPKLSKLYLSSILFVEITDPAMMAMRTDDFFQCDTAWSDDLNLDFPGRPLWTDLTSVAPSLKKIELVLAQFSPELEEWLPFLSQLEHRDRDSPGQNTSVVLKSTPNPVWNSSVEHLKISGRSVSFRPETLGKLVKCFPHLKKIEIHDLKAPAFLPLVEHDNLSTFQELLCFLFGIQSPLKTENDSEIKTEIPVKEVAMGDDPVPKTTKTIPTLLNLKNLQELWVSFSLCQIAEKREFLGLTGQIPTTSLTAALQMQYSPPAQFDGFFAIPTLPVSLFGPPTNKCFLARIPNLRNHFGSPNNLKQLHISCSDHDI